MRAKLIILTALCCLLPITGSARASTAGVVVGTATEQFSECSPGHLSVALSGQQVVPGTWSFEIAVLNTEPTCTIPAFGMPFVGEWSSAGGCVPIVAVDLVLGPFWLCLTNPVPLDENFVEYDFDICDQPPPCGVPNKAQVLVLEA